MPAAISLCSCPLSSSLSLSQQGRSCGSGPCNRCTVTSDQQKQEGAGVSLLTVPSGSFWLGVALLSARCRQKSSRALDSYKAISPSLKGRDCWVPCTHKPIPGHWGKELASTGLFLCCPRLLGKPRGAFLPSFLLPLPKFRL